LRVRLLGGFNVFVNGQIVPASVWRQRRAAAVVKLLALESDHRLHREQLMEQLWPELELHDQANNLRQMLHHARKHLEAAGMPRGTILVRDGESVVLAAPTRLWVDVVAFERAVDAAWRSLSPMTVQAALALYAGDLLPSDPYDVWADDRRMSLRTSYLALLTRLGQFYTERGQLSEAIGVFQGLIDHEPTRESAYLSLMRLHLALDQRDVALAQYDRLVSALTRDGLEPELATRAVADIIRSDRHPFPGFGWSTLASGTTSRSTTITGHAAHLPDRLIGRERELAEICQLLVSSRLVTLSGPGGIGKTALALTSAAMVSDVASDGAVFVDFAPVRDPGLVLSTIADALDVRELHDRPLRTVIRERLNNRSMLLVLDNFEHLMPAAATLADLLHGLPTITTLVTSRARLNLHGEREYRVGPLPVSTAAGNTDSAPAAAVALFVTCAREVRPGFTLTHENAGAVTAICTRLDGLPLAIELAAARIRMLTPEALLERLGQPLAFLIGGAVDRPERQQTMRNTIAWSYESLSPHEQLLFRQLSVFVAGWTLEAAEALVDPRRATDPRSRVLDGLTSLLDKHLVTQRDAMSGAVRFGMLETIREFGIEQLDVSGEMAATRDRHAAWVVGFADLAAPHLELSDQAVWLARLDEEQDNLRAALSWIAEQRAVELGLRLVRALRLHWFMRGRLLEGCDWTLTMVHLPESENQPALSADGLISAGFLAREYGDYERADTVSRQALMLSHGLNDRRRAADAMVNLGFVALQRGAYTSARSLFTRVLSTYRHIDHQQGIADAVSFLGLTLGCLGDDSSARAMIEEAIIIWEALDDRQALVVARTWLGTVYVRQNDIAAAYGEFMRALEIANELGFDWAISWSFDGFAQIALTLHHHHLALNLIVAARHMRSIAGIRSWPTDAQTTDTVLDGVRAALGDDVVARALSNQQAVPTDELRQAIGEAFRRSQDSTVSCVHTSC